MSHPVYCISGWGYSANIYPDDLLSPHKFIRLNYSDLKMDNLSDLVSTMSQNIQNQSNLIAWSFGGLLAILLAGRFPHLVNSLVLIASQPKMMADENWSGISGQDADYFLKSLYEDEAAIRAKFLDLSAFPARKSEVMKLLQIRLQKLTSPLMVKFLEELFSSDLRGEYSRLNCRILHIINDRDAILKQDANALKRLNSEVSIEVVKNAGHAGFLTHQKHYREMINAFLC